MNLPIVSVFLIHRLLMYSSCVSFDQVHVSWNGGEISPASVYPSCSVPASCIFVSACGPYSDMKLAATDTCGFVATSTFRVAASHPSRNASQHSTRPTTASHVHTHLHRQA